MSVLSKDRCGDFWVDETKTHQRLATSCIQLMSQTLKKDICNMHAPGTQASQVESSRLQEYLPPEVQYACLYWVQHLQKSDSQINGNEETHQFLQAHLLHWLEALGWIGKTSEGIQAILALEAHFSAIESQSDLPYTIDQLLNMRPFNCTVQPLCSICVSTITEEGGGFIEEVEEEADAHMD
ncbi:hypothetical protein IFR05_016502 [Cadophora sp. M221]|nr:hypothetical protein IFR05_016502 [Cadophora sp. M221]